MIPRIRTIALLMLLAGLSLGIFASRALRAMGPDDLTADRGSRITSLIEQRVQDYRDHLGLDDTQSRQVRRVLENYDRRTRDLIWTVRRQHEDEFRKIYEDADREIRRIVEGEGD